MNKLGNVESNSDKKNITVKSVNSIFSENFYFDSVYDEKKMKKFIKYTERMIRSSKEYKLYIWNLRNNFAILNSDNIQSNINTNDVELEFHHYPFSLYDIVEIVVYKNISDDKKITSFSIAKEVMKEHNKNRIGLVSLSKTNHELAHCGKLFLRENQIFGNYKKFMEEYEAGISEELKAEITKMQKRSSEEHPTDFTGIYK